LVEDQVKKVLSKLFSASVDSITDTTSPETLPKWDSLGHISLCLALEEEFGLEFSVDQVLEMKSYGSIIRVLTDMGAS
jgi:acyl carrier protein